MNWLVIYWMQKEQLNVKNTIHNKNNKSSNVNLIDRNVKLWPHLLIVHYMPTDHIAHITSLQYVE
ncbi:hypothetical protein A0H81_08355 [Grifola frondosa]|uniref:Uncharacterized protein n=1 Tax=Grifola frondosa TaxID=5627 RepID=A0A1C7M8B2_GRIFR|nr:hypothetical protein A0H81_08355 [Grifola frondosa]